MNSDQQQQRIMGYFIEEAREHLQTIEQGVLNLQDILHDSESVNELFRAAHSIKGGAAMLGVVGIQHVSHRLEDFFKILKENPNVNVDERLKSLLLAGFDPLSELLDELQGSFKIPDELTTETNNRVKPVFAELESYLNQLVADIDPDSSTHSERQGVTSLNLEMSVLDMNTPDMNAPDMNESGMNESGMNESGINESGMNAIAEQPKQLISPQELAFQQEVTTRMRDMLQLFRGDDSAESRSQLQTICSYFQGIGNNFGLPHWTKFVTQVRNAIAQPSNSYRSLAPILIRELKEAQDLVLAGRESEITVSVKIQDLLPYRFTDNEDDEISSIFTAVSVQPVAIAASSEISDVARASEPSASQIISKVDPDQGLDLFVGQDEDEAFDLSSVPIEQMDWMENEYEINESQHIDGPKVGASELKSLAILFENDDIDFDAAWEDIESNEAQISAHGTEAQTSDGHDDFADLLNEDSNNQESTKVGNSSKEASSIDQLFGEFSTDFATVGSLTEPLAIANTNTNFDTAKIASDLDAMIADSDNSNQFFQSFDDNTPEDFELDLAIDLGLDIIDQANDELAADNLIFDELVIDENDNVLGAINLIEVSQQSETIEQVITDDLSLNVFDDVNFDVANLEQSDFEQPNLPDLDFGVVEALTSQDLTQIQENSQQDTDSISSEDYFAELTKQAELTRQEEAIADSISTDSQFSDDLFSEEVLINEPFALTFSEEGLGLLEDPFAIGEEIDDALLEADAIAIVDQIVEQSVEQSVVADVDIFGDSQDNPDLDGFSPITNTTLTVSETIISSEQDSDFSIFDELGFDSDESHEELNVHEDIDHNLDMFADDMVDNVGSLDNFFDGSDISEIEPNPTQGESDIFAEKVSNIGDLGDFFTGISENLEENLDGDLGKGLDEFIGNEPTNESSLDSWFTDDNLTDDTEAVPSIEDDLTTLENIADDTEAVPSIEDDLTTLENIASDNNFYFDEPSSGVSIGGSIDSLVDLQAHESVDGFLSIDHELAFSGENINFESETITASSTIDSLVDFFQGEDDAEISVLQISQESTNDNLNTGSSSSVDTNINESNEFMDLNELDGFGEFVNYDEDLAELVNLKPLDDQLQNIPQDDQLNNLDELTIQDDKQEFFSDSDLLIEDSSVELELPIEELNGIDDNFDFDDLEAMIGGSLSTQNQLLNQNQPNQHQSIDLANRDHQQAETQSEQKSDNNQQLIDSDDMNFDELEALLGDSSSFETLNPMATVTSPNSLTNKSSSNISNVDKPPTKTVDDFDDLQVLLRDSFSKDVGPIQTKAPARTQTANRKLRPTDSTMRVDVKYLDSLNNLVGELVVNRNLLEEDQERLQQSITSLLHQVQLLSDVSQRMRDQYDRSLLEASLSAGRGRSYSNFDASYNDGSNSGSSASNDFEGIEFDRYNTFHVLSQEIIELIVRVRESASDIEFVVGETDQVTRQLGTITTQVQDDLKQSRMVPFAQIGDRLPRGIRDRALKSGKQAELEIFGRETLIDKAILEQLTDPLTHLVNNAIDHGLEDPSTRQKTGKTASGKLTVRAYHQGNQTIISISDDGAGISTDKVKQSAVSKGLRTQEQVNLLNDAEVYALLFEAGFSTAAKADEFKGRGVGLDVVKTCLDEIRGVIIVESAIGKGTTFTIRLPLTLSISKAMFCISDRARVAFPVDGFEDMVEVPQSQIIINEKGQPCLPWRDTVLPFQHLSNLLSYSRHLSRSSIYGKQENDELCIIILRNEANYLALQVDQFLGEYEIVIKQLEGPIPQPAGIAGATVLGDGRVMAIANVLELFDIASGRLRPTASGMTIHPTIEEDIAADPTVLIVDDSITVRELLSLTFAKVGYRVEQAKDGQDAWEKLRAGLPCDMIFCDIEMPRMDGLDLLSRLQKDSRLNQIPVAMLTSRGADRHRQSAIQLGAKGYFTKPYLEEELLSASKRLLAGETLPI